MRERGAPQPFDRRDVDDRASAGPDHLVHHGLGAKEGAGQIDVEGVAPAFEFEFAHGLAARDAGIVDQDVEMPVPPHRFGDGRGPLLGLGHVETQVMCVVADLLRDRATFVVEYVADHYLGPLADQQARMFGAHPAGTAGD
ncbi:hypothetical protein MCOO_45880 [Mycobacterium cookii]|uniref:Uncharacterized protein n=1 Tax=Mycobacterium cookii TaxID=1775 RepID=A0A7I7L367_9MYCO|nr:hypothetical protein MCOO_45880 [Mycobacterium cookii]